MTAIRPFVESRRPYTHFRYSLPSNASDFSNLETQSVRLQVIHDESLCPIASGDAGEHGLCWRIESDIEHLRMTLSDSEILRMHSAEEIVSDGIRYSIDLDFEPNPTTREGVVFRESRSIAWMVGVRRLIPGTYLEMNEERLHCNLFKYRDELQISIQSTKTGDIIYSWYLAKLTDEIDIDRLIEQTEVTLSEISESYFGTNTDSLRIINYQKILADVKSKVGDSMNP